MSDLRVDGAYVERDGAIMYLPSPNVLDLVGTAALWIKPSYFPEMAGKPRAVFTFDTLKRRSDDRFWQIMNGLWFFASADAPAFAPSPNEGVGPRYAQGHWRPASMACGYSTYGREGGGVGQLTDTLNHQAHSHGSRTDLLRHHGWTHVTYMWNTVDRQVQLWINGEPAPNMAMIRVDTPDPIEVGDYLTPGNLIRLGEPSRTTEMTQEDIVDNQVVSRNWAADATIDEFFLWKGNQLERGQEIFASGRYHCPQSLETVFTSRNLVFPVSSRALPSPSDVIPPGNQESPIGPAVSASPLATRILAAAWTWYPESVSWTGQPQIKDAFSETELTVFVEMRLIHNGVERPEIFTDSGGSAVPDLIVDPADSFRYRLLVRLQNASPQTILLATPVIDDVTLYVSSSSEYLAYEVVETSL
ncbi:MAG: hypothetical protein HYY16_06270 [Planctomycetes bacterium]|nr:hypothetical protein [Planctomycetota bacterium]